MWSLYRICPVLVNDPRWAAIKKDPGCNASGVLVVTDYLYSSTRRVRCSQRSLAASPNGDKPRWGPRDKICSAEVNSAGIKVLGPRPKTLGRRTAPPRLRRGEEPAQSKTDPGCNASGVLVVSDYLYSSTRRVRCSQRSLAASSFWAKSSLARSGKARVREE